MTNNFQFAHWVDRLRAPLFSALILVLASCNTTDSFTPEDNGLDVDPATPVDAPSFSTSFAGGIPIGLFHTPSTTVGTTYNGILRNIFPSELLSELKAIRDRGGKVVLNLAGSPNRYTDRYGNFSLTMWKNSIDRFRGVNFSSYITDGTVIGNFLIDEPNDPHNWKNGKPVSPSTLEEMARYSKSRWSNMATLVRVRPDYLLSTHKYLDAAWSQYHSRFGDPYKFVTQDASIAKNKGLALIIGMNVLDGNNGSQMSASQIKSWGGALLNSSYPCAFISWKYNSTYLSTTSVKDAMKYLRTKAQSRAYKTCRS
jgi:hypothetical protein